MKIIERGQRVAATLTGLNYKADLPENWDELEEDLTGEEYENFTDEVMDQATAAETIPELEAEIASLEQLEHDAHEVVLSGSDRKWEELSVLLQDRPEMYTSSGARRKLIIFTEHKDTLNYLYERITGMLGKKEAVCYIHGGVNRDQRRQAQEEFRNNPDVLVMLATDAAGEGVNLQNANLMVNYDLPWNPNRLEQRFGRIHRIGQTEVCHLWNMVANETREGQVFQRLFEKLEVERKALGGRVFDILGEAFENRSLKDLLVDAIRYGESPEVRAKLNETIDGALNFDHLEDILKRSALVEQHLSLEELYAVKEEMEKAEARKLQPFFIRAFFNESFKHLGGELRQRENQRYEIRHVPASIRERDRVIGESRTPVLKKYERICFEKDFIRVYGKPMAELLHPAHPLMAACTDLVLNNNRPMLKQGAILLDPNDDGVEPRILFMIDHSVRESMGEQLTVSRRLQFVEIDAAGVARFGGWAPHLDLQALKNEDLNLIEDVLESDWINKNLEQVALSHASTQLVPEHYQEVKSRRERQADKIEAAVHERLVKEINYWGTQYIKLKEDVEAGKKPRMQPEMARRRNEELGARLEQRKKELALMRHVVSSTPVVIGGALVIPQGLLAQRKGHGQFSVDAAARQRIEKIAMDAVMQVEQSFGHQTFDMSAQKCGWDITARPPLINGKMPDDRHIEVKGRAKGFDTITITRNEIIYGLNQADKFILAIVLVNEDDSYEGPYYLKNPFQSEPDFGVTSNNYNLKDLLSQAMPPEATL